jgi:Ca-activated chloride channel family protein
MNVDDPKLTAYALDELSHDERAKVETALAGSPEAQRFVAEIRELANSLKKEYSTAIEEEKLIPANLIDIRDDPWFWSIARPLSIAAIVALFAVIGAIVVGKHNLGRPGAADRFAILRKDSPQTSSLSAPPIESTPFADVEGEISPPALALTTPGQSEVQRSIVTGSNIATAQETGPSSGKIESSYGGGRRLERGRQLAAKSKTASFAPEGPAPLPSFGVHADALNGIRQPSGDFNTAAYDQIVENAFLDAASNPLSTFSIDVDTASYSNIRRFINDGSLPSKDSVRIEEMINYFTYNYPQPEGDKPFSVNVDVTGCPWESAHRLVRIGLKGREVATDKRGPSNLVFLLDVSGSMTPPERLPLVKQAMRLLVEKLTENDRVAIVVYAGNSGLALPSTNGDHKEQILSAIESLAPGGSTNGAEGIQLAYKVAADHFIKGGVNRVILATDGDFNVGVTSQGDLIRLIEEKAKTGVFLSVLGVGNDNLKDSTMQKLADKGNGNYAYLDSIDEARKVLVQQMNGTLVTIAKDVKIQVEFNPSRVASYRLIGYEKRMLRKEDFNNDKIDAGEIGAGHTVTALYEIVPAGATANPAASIPPVDPLKYGSGVKPASEAPSSSGEMLTVKLRHKKPDGDKSELIERAFTDNGDKFEKASPDLKFAAAVAEFGMILRDSQHKGNGTLGAVLEWAQEGKGNDANGYRAGFIELVRKAQALPKG